MKIFVDTNVLLDVLTQRVPFYDDAANVWSLVEQGIVRGYISALSVNNVFYIARKLRTVEYAQSLVDKILKDFHVIALDYDMLKLARTISNRDYEDLIQYFSAIKSGSTYLITRNKQDFPASGIELLLPEEFLVGFCPESAALDKPA